MTESPSARERCEQAAAEWIARRDSDAWTQGDAAAFEDWLAQSAGHRVAYYRLHAAWIDAGRVRALSGRHALPADTAADLTEAATATAPAEAAAAPADTAAHLTEAAAAPAATAAHASVFRGRRARYFALAASVLMLLAAGLFTFKDDAFVETQHFATVVGGLQSVPLSDGSRVTLNTDSELRITLTARERLVEIDRGEAFFDVAHDPKRPFIVQAGERRVIAVGTQFSVRRDGEELRVVVSEGTVRYEGASGGADVVLLPAGAVASTHEARVQVKKMPVAETERQLTWRAGVLTFRDTPLASAVAEFNRYNARQIVIADPAIAAIAVGGVFRASNVDPFVRLLERGFDVQAAVQPDRIVLTAAPQREGRAP